MSETKKLLKEINSLDFAAYVDVLEKHNITPFDNPARTEYMAKYLLTGARHGLQGHANVIHAKAQMDKLFNDFPHLLEKYADQKVQVTKTKAVKVAKPKTAKVAQPEYADGTVFYRADRKKWMAVLGGKPVAARDTQEKALAFLAKKGIEGVVV